MTHSCSPALAAAVSDAGALGSMGMAFKSAERRAGDIAAAARLTNRAVNLNFFANRAAVEGPGRPDAARAAAAPAYAALGLGAPPEALPAEGLAATGDGFGAAELALLLAVRPRVASFHFGLPDRDAVAALKAAGIRLGATATTTAEARAVEEAGCDFVVAQGFEAGGHRGAHAPTAADGGVGTLALVPQIADAVTLPVVAAGGIADGRGIAAAFALGAAGVQLGTAFLRCPEAATDAPRRARLAAATDSDTIVTAAVSGRSNRIAAGPGLRALAAGAPACLPFPTQYALSGPLRAAGGADYAAHQYGQAAALARELPARELVAALAAEALDRLAWLGRA
ncbi:nitronate monooxygenase family protein [Paralimibaculum aggregatum]|uniref:Propionate 3-nitronate monooxygenase n=2 Tax=Paralimibaculum aggregatum TaxID=3036245 RepID=A0ABQ6LMJ1_9RHOB|nr:nitronate monooxygenase family protein [Limibaculum sp. NKW23]